MTHAVSSPLAPRARAARPRDPRVVLLVVTALVVASLATVTSSLAMLALLGFVCVWHLACTGSASASAASLRRVLPFALVVVLLNAIFGPGEAIVSVGGVRVAADRGLANGVFFALRLGVMLMSVSMLLAAVTPESLAGGIYHLAHPFSARFAERVALFVFISMSFVPLVADEFRRVRVAQGFRGGDFSGGVWRRVEAARAWLIPLLVSAVRRSGQLAIAVELRDIRTRLPRTIAPPAMRVADVVLLVSTAAAIAATSGWFR